MKKLFFLLCILALPLFADNVVPDTDPLVALLQLITQWSAFSVLAKGMLGIVVVVQGVKKFLPGFKYLKFVVVLGGVAYGFLQALASGLPLLSVVTLVFISSGGAIAIYEVFKEPLNTAFQIEKI